MGNGQWAMESAELVVVNSENQLFLTMPHAPCPIPYYSLFVTAK